MVGTTWHYPEGKRDSAIILMVYTWDGTIIHQLMTNVYDYSKAEYHEPNFETPQSITMQGQKVVVAGYLELHNSHKTDFMVMRFRWGTHPPIGDFIERDPTFGNDLVAGNRIVDFGSYNAQANSVAVDSLNRIVAAGSAFQGTERYFAFARLKTDGSPDPTFSGDGHAKMGFNGDNAEAFAVTVDFDDKPVAAGWTKGSAPGATKKFAVARLTIDGIVDQSFGSGTNSSTWGRVTTNLMCDKGEEIRSLVLDTTHNLYRLYAIGNTGGGNFWCFTN